MSRQPLIRCRDCASWKPRPDIRARLRFGECLAGAGAKPRPGTVGEMMGIEGCTDEKMPCKLGRRVGHGQREMFG
jgi:hypothetical protein